MNSIVNIKKIAFNPLVFFLGLGLFFMGCQNIEYPEKPKDLIPEDKMVEVLVDVHVFNAAKSVNRLPLQQTGMTPHQFIYEKHAIDSIQYENSNAYYGADLNKYGRIHNRVKDFLELKKRKIDTTIAREKRKVDSIKFVTDSLKLLRIEGLNNSSEGSKVLKKLQTDTIK
ncbi:MAG: DUF4296 domain-containing protein [Flavobacteriaceae bacterium]